MKLSRLKLLVAVFALLSCVTAQLRAQDAPKKPQPKYFVFGSDSAERGTTRVGYWSSEKNMGAGQLAIDYGGPVWKKDYEDTAKFDTITKGKVYGLGSNFWTIRDPDMPLVIAGKTIPAGSWYLGLHRSHEPAGIVFPAITSGISVSRVV